jgi:fucose permease
MGGMACSIVFPYAMSLALAAMPDDKDRVAGALVAALMTGEGLGTFAIGTLRSDEHASLQDIYRLSAMVAFALAIVATLACRASPESAVNSSR